ncbi:MAG: hypothetical protein QMC95_06415 [Desulfitobacteriaceae bacterium]|nr:hypothetical protein [Desulfitobacteriaceae bacterium]
MDNKLIFVDVPPETQRLLKQFLHTDTLGTRSPLFIVQDFEGAKRPKRGNYNETDWRDVAYFFSREEARRYIEYQRHNLRYPRIYAKSPGYSNDGDWEPFYQLLKRIAGAVEGVPAVK